MVFVDEKVRINVINIININIKILLKIKDDIIIKINLIIVNKIKIFDNGSLNINLFIENIELILFWLKIKEIKIKILKDNIVIILGFINTSINGIINFIKG